MDDSSQSGSDLGDEVTATEGHSGVSKDSPTIQPRSKEEVSTPEEGRRDELRTAAIYDIVPTIAAPQATSINAISATSDLRWVFTGGADGYIRKFNWTDTINGRLPLTVAQRHSFVDSVTKAAVLVNYWESGDEQGAL